MALALTLDSGLRSRLLLLSVEVSLALHCGCSCPRHRALGAGVLHISALARVAWAQGGPRGSATVNLWGLALGLYFPLQAKSI